MDTNTETTATDTQPAASPAPAAAAPAPKPERVKQPEQNGVVRPKPGTEIARVWETAEALSNTLGRPATRDEARKAMGDTINPATFATQYARWTKFHNVSAVIKANREAAQAEKTKVKNEAKATADADKAAKKAEKQAARDEKKRVAAEQKAQAKAAADAKKAEEKAAKEALAWAKANQDAADAAKAAEAADAAKAAEAAKAQPEQPAAETKPKGGKKATGKTASTAAA